MGFSTATLHFYGANREEITDLLPDNYLLRENNLPWTDVLPGASTEIEEAPSLERLAKRITKTDPACAGLLFYYFDDDVFRCVLYRGGRRMAACDSEGSWAKLGKALDQLFGDGAAPKAFRYASHGVNLEEKLKLLEENVGTALLDAAEFEPRTVPRSEDTLRAIKDRVSALRKRPNQYVLTELPREDWPLAWQAQLGLYEAILPTRWADDAGKLLYELGQPHLSVPHAPELAAFRPIVFDDAGRSTDRIITRSFFAGTLKRWTCTEAALYRPLWRTEQSELVGLTSIQEPILTPSGIKNNSQSALVCLRGDGSTRWKFKSPVKGVWFSFADVAADGTITLYINGDCSVSRSGFLYRINGETGEVLRSRIISAEEGLRDLVYVAELNGFVYNTSDGQEIVLLDEALEEVERWRCDKAVFSLDSAHITGSILWDQWYQDKSLHLLDLRTGACREIIPEIPVFVTSLLPDGRFLGVNDSMEQLTIFDSRGQVISRHKAQSLGRFSRICWEAGRVLLLERRIPKVPFICEELFAGFSVHVWRLDPA